MRNFKMVIPVHSFIDVVTNSSTSIYVGCHDNTIQYAKDLIDSLLKAAGSGKTADEVFNFVLSCDFDNEEYRLEEYLGEENSKFNEMNPDEKEKLMKDTFNKMLSGEVEPYSSFGTSGGDCDYDQRTLIITSKSGEISIDLTEKMENIFSIEASYE